MHKDGRDCRYVPKPALSPFPMLFLLRQITIRRPILYPKTEAANQKKTVLLLYPGPPIQNNRQACLEKAASRSGALHVPPSFAIVLHSKKADLSNATACPLHDKKSGSWSAKEFLAGSVVFSKAVPSHTILQDAAFPDAKSFPVPQSEHSYFLRFECFLLWSKCRK